MRPRARIGHLRAASRVLRSTDRRIRLCAIRLAELRDRNSQLLRPERHRLIEVESLVEIEANPKARLVDVEEVAEPRAEEGVHARIAFGESDSSVGLLPFAPLEHRSGG